MFARNFSFCVVCIAAASAMQVPYVLYLVLTFACAFWRDHTRRDVIQMGAQLIIHLYYILRSLVSHRTYWYRLSSWKKEYSVDEVW